MADDAHIFVDAHDTIEAARLSTHIERNIYGGWSMLGAIERWTAELGRPLPENFRMLTT